ncbi:Protein of unknown function [Cupriavidus alkaliphilus]|nr:Protein of unknown function [Cupriavidus alkaliphilus]
MADLTDYTGLVTSEHSQRPKFMSVVAALAQPMVDLMNLLGGMPDKFDLDQAVGAQLDDVGRWVGISRRVSTPLTGVYFSFDTPGVGFDQGSWKGPFDSDTGLTLLDDDTYRLVLRAKIGANHWDGTLESTAGILNSIFSPGDGPVAVHANAEPFGTGDGASTQFQLLYQGQPVYQIDSATLYRNDWQGNQLMYQTPRTNIATYSEQLDLSAWGKAALTVTPNATTAPNGTTTMDKLVETATTGTHALTRNIFGTLGNTPYTVSAFVKAGERRYGRIRLGTNIGFVADAKFDLVTGKYTNSAGNPIGDIIHLGGGIYRVTVTGVTQEGATNLSGTGLYLHDLVTGGSAGGDAYAGDGTSGYYAWGLDVKEGPDLTSYVSATNAPATLTDYTLGPSGIAQLAVPPAAGASLSWTGDGEIYPSGTYVFIQDNQDMSMTIGVAGKVPSAVFLALLEGGYIPLKPEGVRVNFVIVTSVDGVPMFGFDVANQYVMGLDAGAWGTPL